MSKRKIAIPAPPSNDLHTIGRHTARHYNRSMDTLTAINATSTVTHTGRVDTVISPGFTSAASLASLSDINSNSTGSRTVLTSKAPEELKSQPEVFGTTGGSAGAGNSTGESSPVEVRDGPLTAHGRKVHQVAPLKISGRIIDTGNKDLYSAALQATYVKLRADLPPAVVEVGNSGRLFYWSKLPRDKPKSTGIHVFSTHNGYVYEPFSFDFGPLHLGHVYNYCTQLYNKFKDPELMDKLIVHETAASSPNRAANVVLLMCAYQVIMCGVAPSKAYQPFVAAGMIFPSFRDATYGHFADYELTILECLQALEMAARIGWFDYRTFNISEYEHYEKLDNGDVNWIIPKKFLAFCGPTTTDDHCSAPQAYIEPFKKLGVKMVIRLNRKQYNRKIFTDAGIRHADLYFVDGSCPPDNVVEKFLQISEEEPGAIAVHCKAGLGRTGTLIGLYAMKNYRFPARLWVAWNRLCRPGSILGPQQQYLSRMQPTIFSYKSIIAEELQCPQLNAYGTVRSEIFEECLSEETLSLIKMSPENEHVATFGDMGQGERLVNARHAHGGSTPSSPAVSSASTSADSSVRSLTTPTADKDLFKCISTPTSSMLVDHKATYCTTSHNSTEQPESTSPPTTTVSSSRKAVEGTRSPEFNCDW